VVALGADGETRLNQVWFLLRAQRREEARALLEALANDRSVAAEAAEALAAMDIEAGRLDEARKRLDDLLRSGQNVDAASWYLAEIASKAGDRQLALDHLARITTGPRASAALLRRVRLYEELGRSVEAEVALNDFLNDNPSSTVEVAVGRAALLLDQQRADGGLELLERLRSVYPDADAIDGALATLQERTGRVDAAVRTLRHLLERRPGDPTAQNALGYVLVDRTSKVDEGMRLIERALAAKPDNGPIVDSMGWALVRSGRAAEGLPLLERAWRLTDDAEVASHLGTALWQLGRRDEAHELWNRALKDHPDNRHLLAAIAAHPRP
jgi:tetratricopeptide (TPR) repeat protein